MSVAGPPSEAGSVDQIGNSVHDAIMEATPDPTPSRRDVLGDHPKSFDPGFTTGTSEERNEAEAAAKAQAIAAEKKAAEAAKAAEAKAA